MIDMSKKEQLLERIDHILRSSGVTPEKHEIGIRCRFQLAGGRQQIVEIEPVTRTPEDNQIISFFSRCERLGKGWFDQISGAQAISLLKLNSTLPIGYFCIKDIEGQRYLCVQCTQLLETMDQEELRVILGTLAQLADQWEERLGQDEF